MDANYDLIGHTVCHDCMIKDTCTINKYLILDVQRRFENLK